MSKVVIVLLIKKLHAVTQMHIFQRIDNMPYFCYDEPLLF